VKPLRDWDPVTVFIFGAVILSVILLVWVGACLPDSLVTPER
jgi:hypothetical protein